MMKAADNHESVTANIKGSSSEYIAGARYGFATVNAQTGEIKYICRMWNPDLDGIDRVEM